MQRMLLQPWTSSRWSAAALTLQQRRRRKPAASSATKGELLENRVGGRPIVPTMTGSVAQTSELGAKVEP